MKLKEKDKYILLAVLGILIAVATYFFVFTKVNDKKDVLVTENVALSEEVAYLQQLMNDKEYYVSETDRMNMEIDEMKAQFPAEVYPEDEIYYAYKSEEKHDVVAKSIAMPEAVQITVAQPAATTQPEVVDDGTTEAETVEGETTDTTATAVATPQATISLFKSAVTFDFQITYASVKDWIKEIVTDDENKKSIESVSLTYDDKTGNIKGVMVVNMFSLTGTDRTYESPNIPGIGVGTDDLFKSSNRLNSAEENNSFDANATDGEQAAEGEEASDAE